MRVLSHQEISAVSGGATSAPAPTAKDLFNFVALGLFWTVASLLGFKFTDFV